MNPLRPICATKPPTVHNLNLAPRLDNGQLIEPLVLHKRKAPLALKSDREYLEHNKTPPKMTGFVSGLKRRPKPVAAFFWVPALSGLTGLAFVGLKSDVARSCEPPAAFLFDLAVAQKLTK